MLKTSSRMKMLQRAKRLWQLSDGPQEIDNETLRKVLSGAPLGDGKAVFLPEMTDAEYDKYRHEEKRGWGKFYDKLFGRA
jgi:hypothetical protein